MQLTWAGGCNSKSCCNSNDECKNIRMMKNRESILYSRCMCNNECKNIRMMKNSNGCCNSNDEGVCAGTGEWWGGDAARNMLHPRCLKGTIKHIKLNHYKCESKKLNKILKVNSNSNS